MGDLFAGGRVLDLILAGMALEAVGLAAYHRRTGRGVAPHAFLPNLLSGMCLLLAMRAGLAGLWWGWVSLCLLGALLLHLSDLRRLWSAHHGEHGGDGPGERQRGRRRAHHRVPGAAVGPRAEQAVDD